MRAAKPKVRASSQSLSEHTAPCSPQGAGLGRCFFFQTALDLVLVAEPADSPGELSFTEWSGQRQPAPVPVIPAAPFRPGTAPALRRRWPEGLGLAALFWTWCELGSFSWP